MSLLIDSLEPRRLLSANINGGVMYMQDGPAYTIRSIVADQTFVAQFKVSKTGTLFITGTGQKDVIDLTVRNGRIQGGGHFFQSVDPNDTSLGATLQISPIGSDDVLAFKTQTFSSLPKIKRISIEGMGGDDKITVNADVHVTVRGARGDDTIEVNAPTSTVDGGSGTNALRQTNSPIFLLSPRSTIFSPVSMRSPTAYFTQLDGQA